MKRIAICVFNAAFDDDPKEYYYFTDLDDLEKGDNAVVDSGPGLGIVEVRGFVHNSEKARCWIVQKIDLIAHRERLKKHERIETLKAQLEARRKKFEKEYLWTMLAEKDSKASELLNEIKSLED